MNTNYEQKLFELLETVAREGASDLHLSAGRQPTLRIDGDLIPLKKQPILAPEDSEGFANVILNEDQQVSFKKQKAIDLSYSYKDSARFRVNVYKQFGTTAIALRFIPTVIRTIEELHLPQTLQKLVELKQGFVLITGPAGQGKSTTLAAMLNSINQKRAEHIITIEDPIEYIFPQHRSIIDQREVGRDALSFPAALRESFRQDPDVIMLGEMRDIETIATTISAAETGHLVFATLHTNSAAQTIDRIIDSFPSTQQNQVRSQLALTLAGIISQRLVPRIEGGRIPAVEILFATHAVRNLIRENKIHEIALVIETNSDDGMISMNRSLSDLVKRGEISMETAEGYSTSPQELRALLGD